MALGTVETRMYEQGIGGFVTHKFWECGPHNNDFTLSIVIYVPHRLFFLFIKSFYLICIYFFSGITFFEHVMVTGML